MPTTKGKGGKEFDPGKWAENEAQKWLTNRSNADARFAWHRYPDAHAARGPLSAQPCDFLIGRKREGKEGLALHLEVKETAEVNRIPKDKITQFGKLYMFHLAGFQTRVLIWRSTHDDWVYLTQRELFFFDVVPKSFVLTDRPTFKTAADALQEMFP